ncbi:aspartate carbamoyltransferase [Moraxella ovis]|uniref:Aspartate carbamoyltransferase n=1 Tax=Moraxella ovis TaxID=29433 RepID=A0A160GFX1_9GAMM|nr:dihydroorotase [Moraxella ovis]ANB91947.1 aspartate carbamoyltransferase [Moraxella ovis]SPX86848.1 Dihydroorotase [Moraxella ovis]STY87689.1 Dihydroorotase [Moraxella ovis]STZ05587.1 Dihydroorotase [Moraxella ovis]
MKNLLPTTWRQPTLNDTPTEGKWLIPPIVDLCARLREPGHQSHGTLASEGRAARDNGILHIVLPPDTNPVLENGSLLKGLRDKARQDGGIHLHILGALTQGLAGKQLANLAGLKQGGVIGVTNTACGFESDLVMLRTLEYAATFGLKVFFYPNEPSLSEQGVAHDGYIASFHGLAGIPWLAETIALSKQLLMVEETGITAHFSQLSCRTSVELIRWAKAKGLPITCDVAMHQLHLTDDALEGYDANALVYPPLRSNTDQRALIQGLQDGTIDAICSHHEPLSASAKQAPFGECAAGISNLDTFVSLGCQLVADGVLSAETLVEKICLNPAKIAGIHDYEMIGGAVLIDPKLSWRVDECTMLSSGKNTPFLTKQLTGKTVATFFD